MRTQSEDLRARSALVSRLLAEKGEMHANLAEAKANASVSIYCDFA